MSTHAGTHMDAPFHHRSRQDGALALTIDEFPLEWCIGPGVKLDFRHVPEGHVTTPAQIDTELVRIGYTLRPGDIVLVSTAAGERYGENGLSRPGMRSGPRGNITSYETGHSPGRDRRLEL
jgi:kynurenine formamidase